MKVYVITNRSFNLNLYEFVKEDQFDTYVFADKEKAMDCFKDLEARLMGFYGEMTDEGEYFWEYGEGMVTVNNSEYMTKLLIEEVELG